MKENFDARIKIDGQVLIEKFDKDGNKIFESKGKNVIKQWVYDYLKNRMKSCAASWISNASTSTSSNSNELYAPFRVVYLLDSTTCGVDGITPSASSEPVFPILTGSHTGYIERSNQTIAGDSKIGIINFQESYATNDTAVFVYQWPTSQGDGEFDTIVHCNTLTPNSTSKAVYSDGENVLMNGKTWNPTVKPTVYCFYTDGALIILHTPVLSGNYLLITSLNMTSGTETTLTIDSWDGSDAPTNMVCYFDGSVLKIVTSLGATCNLSTLTGGTWATAAIAKDGRAGLSMDDTYVYLKNYQSENLDRYNHTTGSEAGNCITANEYMFYHSGKMYASDYDSYFDVSASTWNGDTITKNRHKYGFPNISGSTGYFYNGYIYTFNPTSNWQTGYTGSQTTIYPFTNFSISDYRNVESAHYKNLTVINKATSETLKITYTFNFS